MSAALNGLREMASHASTMLATTRVTKAPNNLLSSDTEKWAATYAASILAEKVLDLVVECLEDDDDQVRSEDLPMSENELELGLLRLTRDKALDLLNDTTKPHSERVGAAFKMLAASR